jgi:hypothetical protein
VALVPSAHLPLLFSFGCQPYSEAGGV